MLFYLHFFRTKSENEGHSFRFFLFLLQTFIRFRHIYNFVTSPVLSNLLSFGTSKFCSIRYSPVVHLAMPLLGQPQCPILSSLHSCFTRPITCWFSLFRFPFKLKLLSAQAVFLFICQQVTWDDLENNRKIKRWDVNLYNKTMFYNLAITFSLLTNRVFCLIWIFKSIGKRRLTNRSR